MSSRMTELGRITHQYRWHPEDGYSRHGLPGSGFSACREHWTTAGWDVMSQRHRNQARLFEQIAGRESEAA